MCKHWVETRRKASPERVTSWSTNMCFTCPQRTICVKRTAVSDRANRGSRGRLLGATAAMVIAAMLEVGTAAFAGASPSEVHPNEGGPGAATVLSSAVSQVRTRSNGSGSSDTPDREEKLILVHGVIYVKGLKLPGYDPHLDASPLPESEAKLTCYGDEESEDEVTTVVSTRTDKTGYFVITIPASKFDRHSCRVYFESLPSGFVPFLTSVDKLGLTLVREHGGTLPPGTIAVYHPKSILLAKKVSTSAGA